MNAGVPVCHVTTAAVAPCRVGMLAALLAMLVLLVPMTAVLFVMFDSAVVSRMPCWVMLFSFVLAEERFTDRARVHRRLTPLPIFA